MSRLLLFLFLTLTTLILRSQVRDISRQFVHDNGKIYQKQYQITLQNTDTILEGKFLFYKILQKEILNKPFNYLYLSGAYTNNRANGVWSLQKGSATASRTGFFNNYHLSKPLDGQELFYSGSIVKGEKQGDWTLLNWKYDNYSSKDTLLYAEVPYKDNQVSGKLTIIKGNHLLEGQTTSYGYTDGSWLHYLLTPTGEKKLIEEWIFASKRITEKINHTKNTKISLANQFVDSAKLILVDIELSREYFDIIQLLESTSINYYPSVIKKPIELYTLFLQSITELNSVDSIVSKESNVTLSPIIKTKIESLPYREEEDYFFKNLSIQLRKKDSLILLFKKSPKIDLVDLSSPKVNNNLILLDAIQNQIGSTIDTLLLLHAKGHLRFVNRDKYILQNIAFSSSVQMPSKNETGKKYAYQFTNTFKKSATNPYLLLSNYLDYLLYEVQLINDSLNYYLFESKKEQNLLEQEAILLERSNRLKRLNDSLVGAFQNELAGFNLTESINHFISSQLMHYARIIDAEEKATKIPFLFDCLEEVEQLIYYLERVPSLYFTVKDAYTNEVFNPYTFTNMEEVSKPNLFKSFNKVILPALFNNLNQLSCDKVELYKNNFSIAFNGMIALLQKDTQKKERKIKRIKNPNEAAQFINLPLVFSNE